MQKAQATGDNIDVGDEADCTPVRTATQSETVLGYMSGSEFRNGGERAVFCMRGLCD